MTGPQGSSEALRPLARLLIESTFDVRGPLPFDLDAVPREQTLAAAEDHRIGPAVFRRLRSAHAPEEWQKPFAAARQRQVLRHLRTHAELDAIGAALANAGVTWLVAKGPVAADVIWPHTDMREYHDLDLFVEAGEFERALNALLDAGCALVDLNWQELARTTRAEVALIAPYGTPIDLHWHIAIPARLRRSFRIDMRGMFARSRTVTIGNGREVSTFDEIDTAIHLAFHAAQAGASKLMWAGDLHYAMNAPGFDAGEFTDRVRRSRVERSVSLVLDRVRSVSCEASDRPTELALGVGGAWGRAVQGLQRRSSFPALPGDRHAGNILVAGTRPTSIGSAYATTRSAIEVRAIERRLSRVGPEDRTLHRDVPDIEARRAYFAAVRGEKQ